MTKEKAFRRRPFYSRVRIRRISLSIFRTKMSLFSWPRGVKGTSVYGIFEGVRNLYLCLKMGSKICLKYNGLLRSMGCSHVPVKIVKSDFGTVLKLVRKIPIMRYFLCIMAILGLLMISIGTLVNRLQFVRRVVSVRKFEPIIDYKCFRFVKDF